MAFFERVGILFSFFAKEHRYNNKTIQSNATVVDANWLIGNTYTIVQVGGAKRTCSPDTRLTGTTARRIYRIIPADVALCRSGMIGNKNTKQTHKTKTPRLIEVNGSQSLISSTTLCLTRKQENLLFLIQKKKENNYYSNVTNSGVPRKPIWSLTKVNNSTGTMATKQKHLDTLFWCKDWWVFRLIGNLVEWRKAAKRKKSIYHDTHARDTDKEPLTRK